MEKQPVVPTLRKLLLKQLFLIELNYGLEMLKKTSNRIVNLSMFVQAEKYNNALLGTVQQQQQHQQP